MLRYIRTIIGPSNRLPKPIFADFVGIVFTSLPPVTLIGVTFAAVGILVAAKERDLIVSGLVVLGLAVTAGRILLILAYRRKARVEGIQDPVPWERRYAIGAYSFAIVLGAFNLRAIVLGDPLIAMLITSVMFGYGAGSLRGLRYAP